MSTNQRLDGKVAIVTGAGSGIGQASALLLAEQGAKLLLIDIDRERVEKVKSTIEQGGGEAITGNCDISHAESLKDCFSEAVDKWGKIDIVFANAGINGTKAPIEIMELDEWDATININLRGTFATVKYAIPYLKEAGGSIIITSSINGNRVFTGFGFSAYSTTKAGQVAFMKMAALELARYKIRVNAICPGAIATNIDQSTIAKPELDEVTIPIEYPEGDQPLADGPGQPAQVAQLVAFLASDDSSHITGTEIYIDGAESLIH
ncbi:3-ketoacyl-(acyl-carrier-protein) reductase [Paenibacillus vortex V453]|uniref:3-ketoacyl-(Acyl-carrier-protein) reductase n=1 Tax=Paenibacillus vortex V453 TaxID=715225 RepID=A0A2R9SRI5_9BACL|nr:MULTISPECIES: SDR family NAD(P)-dependent oxidoreductase [Paenibacillus]AWP27044.1 3-oxoacyl-[acyl-carrier-protein] reductase [Paenibacillus sp. Cedars]EFU39966.1 3-ketoacyl-(acyl-carrier-protein) reductase [Paenibacillus vortex V453]MDH6670426.1 NAD(P)-dependent dehydrogenase (short-subunit alcohol dehydrogenase family) [Paenibacillus sp. LBL]